MDIPFPKFHPEECDENIIVEITFTGPDMKEYQTVGVLIRESEESIRIGFNARDDEVIDFLDIEIKSIRNIREVLAGEVVACK